MLARTRDAEQRHVVARFDPGRAARSPVRNAMRHVAQRQRQPVRQRDRLRQPLEPRRDPAAVALRESLRFAHRPAHRHREQHGPRRGLDAQRIAPRLHVAAQLHRIDLAVERDLDQLRIGRPAEQEGAERHDGIPGIAADYIASGRGSGSRRWRPP
jgi:hypothetical protein